MKLILLRHGEAHQGSHDDARDLNEQGRSEVRQTAEELLDLGIRPDRIVHSPKLRARATAEILASVAGGRLEEDANVKPGSDPDVIAAEARGWSGTVAIASHLPYLPELLQTLTGEPRSFRTAQALVLEGADTSWRIIHDVRGKS